MPRTKLSLSTSVGGNLEQHEPHYTTYNKLVPFPHGCGQRYLEELAHRTRQLRPIPVARTLADARYIPSDA